MKTRIARSLPLAAILALWATATDSTRAAPAATLHTYPVTYQDSQSVSVGDTFAAFGNRPDTDKSGDDGSVAIRDRNGAIIWVDNKGRALVVPNSSIARTLYVSNTECVMYNNRYDGTFDQRGSSSQIVIHRRDADGALVSSPSITINQTIVDTAPITSTTYGFTIIAANSFDDGFAESTERFQSGVTAQGQPVFDIRQLNYWDAATYKMYRITWDAKLQTLGRTDLYVAPNAPNIGSTRVVASGSDGSFVFNRSVAQNFYRDLPSGGYFIEETASYWAAFNLNADAIVRVTESFKPPVQNLGYVSNSRLLAEFPIVVQLPPPNDVDSNLNPQFFGTGNYELRDFRQRTNGSISLANTFALDVGDKILPASVYTRSGMPPYVYTISSSRTELKLYQVDSALTRIGKIVTLPGQVLDDAPLVRNPVDASLLVRAEGATGLLWLPSILDSTTSAVTGLGAVREIPNSSQALPMFVASKEAVAWMNSDAPVDIANGGVVPAAVISHFQRAASAGNVIQTALTPPIEGRYVALPPILTPNPDTEGWFVTTFEKTDSRSALMRSYRLELASTSDRDHDGLSDFEEISFKTDPGNPDTDGDGLTDGEEARSYELVQGTFGWEQARIDAINKGGRLMVLDSSAKLDHFKTSMSEKITGKSYWIGGHDVLTEGVYQWLTSKGHRNGDKITNPLNWEVYQPNNLNNADGMQVGPASSLAWTMAPVTNEQGYVLEYTTSDPNVKDTDGDGLSDGNERAFHSNPRKPDTDGDSLTDDKEKNYGTNPLVKDTDKDRLNDDAEVNVHNSNPLLKDTDADGLDDGDEVTKGTNLRNKDTDSDKLTDGDEVTKTTDPLKPDTDGDGLPDGREVNLGTDPLKKDSDSDGISDYEEVDKGSDPLDKDNPKNIDSDKDGLTDYQELFKYNTDPKIADTDGDGLNDGDEILRGTDPKKADTDGDGLADGSEVDTNSDPFKKDTDDDGLNDKQEADNKTDPRKKDTDGDRLTDAEEVNGYIASNGKTYKTSPLLTDTDGDGYSDHKELTSNPPTNPIKYKSYPPGILSVTPADYHDRASPIRSELVKIGEGFSPFGQRPDVNKTGEDGSSLLRDRNGVLVWVNSNGVALVVPCSTLASPLMVTNNECVVWDNHYADYDSYDEKPQAQIVIYRRNAEGTAVESNTPVPLRGTKIVPTSSVSASSFGFVLVTTEVFDDGLESIRVTYDDKGNPQENEYDQWDGMRMRVYRVAWDGNVQRVDTYFGYLPKSQDDPATEVLGFGSDGSFVFNILEGVTLRSPFLVDYYTLWVTGDGSLKIVPNPQTAEDHIRAGYVSNNRLLLLDDEETTLADYLRQNDNITLETTFSPAGTMLPLADYSRVGSPVYVYTLDDANLLRLYEAGSKLSPRGSTKLPVIPGSNPVYVRNPQDGSLLIRDGRSAGIAWAPTEVSNGKRVLSAAKILPLTQRAMPLYAKADEVVVWSNALVPVQTDGNIQPAEISHYYLNDIGLPQYRRLAPPITGNYVLNSPFLTPNPNKPGWFVQTTQKIDSKSVRINTYRLDNMASVDSDNDGLPDVQEKALGTKPSKPDTDGDGIKDGDEVQNGTDPKNPDTDGDGLNDGRENQIGTNPRDKDTDDDGMTDLEEVRYGSDPLDGNSPKNDDTDKDGLSDYDELKIYGTNPKNPDTDGDGISDGDEVKGSKQSAAAPAAKSLLVSTAAPVLAQSSAAVAASGGTDPNDPDSDDDGLNDGDELKFKTDPKDPDTDDDGINDGREVSIGTNPRSKDTDKDGLTDSEELNWTDSSYTSDPLRVDTDGDLYSDFAEWNAKPKTDPHNTQSKPTGPPDAGGGGADKIHNQVEPAILPVAQTVTIDDTFAPFGQRPNTDKTGDDGSTAIRDPNGVIVWSTSSGAPITLPGTALAKTLYVSNSEVLVYNNRYAANYNRWGTSSEIIIYRRGLDDDGNLTIQASPTITLAGTLVDTAPVTPTTYGYTIVSAVGFNFSPTESTQKVKTGTTTEGGVTTDTYETKQVDTWHDRNYNMYRVTWDGQAQFLSFTTASVPQSNTNLGSTRVLASGDDGSFVITSVVAYDYFDSQDPADGDTSPGLFYTGRSNFWGSWQINSETIHEFPATLSTNITDVAYVSNSRLLIESTQSSNTVMDYRLRSNGLFERAGSADLPAGNSLLALSTYTRSGLQPFIYSIDNATGMQLSLYRYQANLEKVGKTVTLPSPVSSSSAYVRNPRNASLLIKSDGASVLWVPATAAGGLQDCVKLPGTSKGLPMFVSSTEAVAWMNSTALVQAGGIIPSAQISHFDKSLNETKLQDAAQTTPLKGRYVTLPQALSNDPDSEGWFITTFEKTDSRSAVVRNYRLRQEDKLDTDADGLIDKYETNTGKFVSATDTGTNPRKADTDGDGLSDKVETGTGIFVSATDTGTNPNKADTDGDGGNDGAEVENGTDPTKKNIFPDSDKDGLEDVDEEKIGTDPAKPDTDGDGINDGDEVKEGTDPLDKADPLQIDSDGDGLMDREETELGTNPNKKDTDRDGVNDYDEVNVLHTDPIKPSFGGAGTTTVPFGTVDGDYEGVVYSQEDGLTFKQSLRLATNGSFSSSLLGLRSDASFRGQFSSKGLFTGDPGAAEGVTSVQLKLVQQDKDTWYIQGSYKTSTGGTLYVELRPEKYSASKAYGNAGKVTFEASLSGNASGPTGSAVATGEIHEDGNASFSIYLPDGSRSSFSGPILDGNLIAFYSRSSSSARQVILGSLVIRNVQEVSDFDGTVRLFTAVGPVASLFPSGYDQPRYLIGSRYAQAATGTLPLANFKVTDNNAVCKWPDGNFAGVKKVGTWTSDGRMIIPATQNDNASISFNSSTGLMVMKYTRTDRDLDLKDALAESYAVVVQKDQTFKGYYRSDFSAGKFSVVPNTGGLEPEITSVSPLEKFVSAAATTYTVSVGTKGAWSVVIPSDVDWITAKPMKGNGNGTITITVSRNLTYTRRERVLEIAGFNHTLTQDFW